MRKDPLYLSWAIRCRTPAEAKALVRWLTKRFSPENTIEQVIVSKAGGIETNVKKTHRIGDYFSGVRAIEEKGGDRPAFALVFQRQSDASRYWKDVMVRILESIRHRAPAVQTNLLYRGDEEAKALNAR